MKLVSYKIHDKINIGALKEDFIVPFSNDPNIPNDMLSFLEAGKKVMTLAEDVIKKNQNIIPIDSCKLINPILRPPKIIAIGLNYQDHLEEIRAIGREVDDPEVPMIFNKQSTSACGPFEDIHDPKVSDKLDYEGEMAIIIGKTGRYIDEMNAMDHVAGYACYNDATVRDWQKHTSQFIPGKNFYKTGGFGPYMLSADEVSNYKEMKIQTRLNGEIMQDASLNDLIFPIEKLINYCSTFIELSPGDVIVTGTPGGVGDRRDPPVYMKDGDAIEIEI